MEKTYQINCRKCGGSGYLEQFADVKNGVCFSCEGSGTVELNYNPSDLESIRLADEDRLRRNWKKAEQKRLDHLSSIREVSLDEIDFLPY